MATWTSPNKGERRADGAGDGNAPKGCGGIGPRRRPVPSWQARPSAAAELMVAIPFGIGLLAICRWVAEVIA